MRLIIGAICTCALISVLLVTVVATARHRYSANPDGYRRTSAIVECLWALIPWIIMAGAAFPAVHLIATGH
jgi:heme/copper-type cytochrome/quinol oxidase subunit 2